MTPKEYIWIVCGFLSRGRSSFRHREAAPVLVAQQTGERQLLLKNAEMSFLLEGNGAGVEVQVFCIVTLQSSSMLSKLQQDGVNHDSARERNLERIAKSRVIRYS